MPASSLARVARPTLLPIDRMPPLELRTRPRVFGVAEATIELAANASSKPAAEQRSRARESSTSLKARLDGAACRSSPRTAGSAPFEGVCPLRDAGHRRLRSLSGGASERLR